MLSLGTRDDGGKGLGLGFGRRVQMEENELEEGEACSDREEDDDDPTIDPDIALSYIDDKIQDVLGQFQKDFEGGVCAENLGAKFGIYGSFLPAYQRSPIFSRPRSPNKPSNCSVSRSPHIAQLEAICPDKNNVTNSSDALLNKHVSSAQPLNSISNKPLDHGSNSQHELNNRSLIGKNSKSFKVRIKVGSENAHSRNNAAIYSGLGLDMSPSSSPGVSADVSEGSPHRHSDSPDVSPHTIYKLYSCFQISKIVACLLSPIPESTLHLEDKKTQRQNKSKSEETNLFRDDNNYVGKNRNPTGKNGLSEGPFLSGASNINPKVGGNSKNGLLGNADTHIYTEKEIASTTPSGLEYGGEKSASTVLRDGEKISGVSKRPQKYIGKRRGVSPERVHGELSGNSMGGKPLRAVTEQLPSKSGFLLDSCPDVKNSFDLQNNGMTKSSNKPSSPREDDEEHRGRKNGSFKLKPPPKSDINEHARDRSFDGKLKSSGGKRKHKESSSSITPLEPMKGTSSGASMLAPKEKKKSLPSKNDLMKSDHNASRPPKEINRSVAKEGNMINTHFEEDERGDGRVGGIGDRIKHGHEDTHIQPAQTEHPNGRKMGKINESISATADKGSVVTAVVGDVPSSGPGQHLDEWVCCDKCQKWRLLPFGATTAKFPQNWVCSMLDWLPGMNKCSVSEDDTSKACKAMYEPLPSAGHVALMGSHDVVQSVTCADMQHRHESGDLCPGVPKKQPIVKDALDVPCQPPTVVSVDHVKLKQQTSVGNKNLNDVKLSTVDLVVAPCKSGTLQLSKTLDFSTESPNLKQKRKDHSRDQYPAGGNSVGKIHKRSKSKSTAEFIQDGKISKKIKLKGPIYADEDSHSNHSFGCKVVDDIDYSSKKSSKNHEISFSSDSKLDLRDNLKKGVLFLSAEKVKDNLYMSGQDMPNISVKRKLLKCQENGAPSGADVQEEAFGTIRRKEKKFKLSKTEGRELSVSTVALKTDKCLISAGVAPLSFNMGRIPNAVEKQGDGDKLDRHCQKSNDSLGSLKRESVHPQPSTATSSSSKVSGSRKSKTRFSETIGSPVESVSSSPLRNSAINKLTTKRNRRTDDTTERDSSLMLSPRRGSAGKINGKQHEFGTKIKLKAKDTLHSGSLEINRTGDFKILDPAYCSQNKIGDCFTGKTKNSLYTKLFGCADDQPSPSGCEDIDIGSDAIITSEQPYINTYSNSNSHYSDAPQIDAQKKSGKISSQTGTKHIYSMANNGDKIEIATSQRSLCLGVADNQPSSRSHVTSNVVYSELQDAQNDTYKSVKESKNSSLKIGVQSRYENKRESLTNSSYVVVNKEANGSYSQASKYKDLNAKISQSTTAIRIGEDLRMEEKSQITGSKVDKRDCDQPLTGRIDKSSRGNLERLPNIKDKNQEFQDHALQDMHLAAKDDMSDDKFADDVKGHSENHLKQRKNIENQSGRHDSILKHNAANGLDTNSVFRKSPSLNATNVIKEARDLKHTANRIKNEGLERESATLYFQAALKFLHAAALLESSSSDNAKLGEMISSTQMYSETAKFCEFCAHEYEKQKEMFAAALAYKCMEVAYMKVAYSKHPLAIKDRQELQVASRIGESPSSSASDVDNVNNQSNADKMTSDKITNSTQVAGSHVIAARNRPNFVRLLSFAEIVNFAMDASRRSINAFGSASMHNVTDEDVECLLSVKRVLDFSFYNIEGLLRLVRLSMEHISR